MYAAVVALFVTAFVLPQHVQAENYNLLIGGKKVTSENCGDLTAIDGVKGKAKYDPASNTLTLDKCYYYHYSREGCRCWSLELYQGFESSPHRRKYHYLREEWWYG